MIQKILEIYVLRASHSRFYVIYSKDILVRTYSISYSRVLHSLRKLSKFKWYGYAYLRTILPLPERLVKRVYKVEMERRGEWRPQK